VTAQPEVPHRSGRGDIKDSPHALQLHHHNNTTQLTTPTRPSFSFMFSTSTQSSKYRGLQAAASLPHPRARSRPYASPLKVDMYNDDTFGKLQSILALSPSFSSR
jgi:hypothetical protein